MFKNRIIDWLEDYRIKTDCKGVVLGISGGKDSTVCAMLAKKVWGDDVFGIIMPNGAQKDIDDAIKVCESIGIDYRIVNIETIYNNLILNVENRLTTKENIDWVENCPKISEKAKTNIPPRIRMTILYSVAQTLGYRVMGTGNASERFIGWFTKWGDGAHDFNPLAHFTCSEVVDLGLELCEEFKLPKELIKKIPADGLTGKSDEDNFGFTYKQLDDYIQKHTSGNYLADEKIEKLHKQSKHKLKMPYTTWDKLE